MKNKIVCWFLAFFLIAYCEHFFAANIHERTVHSGTSFIENKGQVFDTDGNLRNDVRFTYEGSSSKVFITKSGFYYVTGEIDKVRTEKTNKPKSNAILDTTSVGTISAHRIDWAFLNADVNSSEIRSKPYSTVLNYYLGAVKIENVKLYEEIKYESIYKNIDIVYHIAGNGKLKYDWIVNPGGNIEDIMIKINGADNVYIDNNQLVIVTSLGNIVEEMPRIYQIIEGKVIDIKGKYRLSHNTSGYLISFEIPNYNKSQSLIIDPWASYFGGSGEDIGVDITVDKNNGDVVITGKTLSNNLPTTAGPFQTKIFPWLYNIFVARLDADGSSLNWCTYYSGTNEDEVCSIATDAAGNAIITGTTKSSDLPITPGAYQTTRKSTVDAFVARFNVSAGTLLWATFLGGSQMEFPYSIYVSKSTDNVILCGVTKSNDFPLLNELPGQSSLKNASDAFITIFNPTGNCIFSTYYGGNNDDEGTAVMEDGAGNIFMTGYTHSTDLPQTTTAFQPTLAGGVDGFLTKIAISPISVINHTTYYGTTGDDIPTDLTIDKNNNVVITGQTGSAGLPVTATTFQPVPHIGGVEEVFVARFNNACAHLWSTYLGGSAAEEAPSIATDNNNNIFVTGDTYSADFPVTGCAFQTSSPGGTLPEDQFITKFSENGKCICSGYMGGTGHDESDNKFGDIVVYGNSLYMILCSDFYPVTAGAYQTNHNGLNDVVVTKVCPNTCGSDKNNILNYTSATTLQTCYVEMEFEDLSILCDTNFTTRQWYFTGANISSSTEKNPSGIKYYSPGVYPVKLIIESPCGKDSLIQNVNIVTVPISINVAGTTTVCAGQSTVLSVSGANTYTWVPSVGISSSTGSVVTANPLTFTTYSVIGTDTNGCSAIQSITVSPITLSVSVSSSSYTICPAQTATITATGALNYTWETGEGLMVVSNGIATANPTSNTTYTVIGTDANSCKDTVQINIQFHTAPIANAGIDDTICLGEIALLNASGGTSYLWNTGAAVSTINVSPPTTTTYSVMVSDGICNSTDSVKVFVNAPSSAVASITGVLSDESFQLNGSGGAAYQWIPTDGLSCNTCYSPTAKPLQQTTYTLVITDSNGCTSFDTVLVEGSEFYCSDFYIPNAFSPNDDGQNDLECVYGSCIKSMVFTIYNRWGEIVFETNNIQECWNGFSRGTLQNSGVYTYFFIGQFTNGKSYKQRGNITLIK